MKILYIIDGMFNSAGREHVVANKAVNLSHMGHQITVVTTDQRGRQSYYPLPASVEMVDLNINYDEYNGKNIVSKFVAHRSKNRMFRKRLGKFLKANPQDVIVTLMDRYVPAVLALAGKSVTVYEHHFNKFAMYDLREARTKHLLQQLVYGLKDWYYTRFFYKELDIFAVLTEEDKEYWGDGFKNLVCMPNSISYTSEKTTTLENPTVISVGRLTFQKGFDRLIDVWHGVELNNPKWKLQIYGNGEDKEMLLSKIEKYGLKNVTIHPPTSDIEDRLLEASLYVMTSRFEGLPMVLLEAMAVGLPLASFDCKCGPRDVIEDGKNGYLIPDGDLQLMEERICSLLIDKEKLKEMSRYSKETAERFSHENIMKRWIELFQSVKK